MAVLAALLLPLGQSSPGWLLPFFGSPRAMAVTGIVPLLTAVKAFNILLGQGPLLPFGMVF